MQLMLPYNTKSAVLALCTISHLMTDIYFLCMSLLYREAPLTRDQLLAKLESVKTRIKLLQAMRDTTSSELDETDIRIQDVKKGRDEKDKTLTESTKGLEETRKSCWLGIFGKDCDIKKKEGEVTKALSESSAANLRVETLEFQFGAKSQMKAQIEVVLARLNLESDQLERQLEESQPSSSSSLVDDVGTTQPLDAQEIQDNWLLFDFSSTKSSKESSSYSFDSSSTATYGNWFTASGTVSSSFGYQSFSEHVKSADVRIRAKVLKVKINRPWFRLGFVHE